MLEKFKKALERLSVDCSDMRHATCEKYMYKFNNDVIQEYWLCFYAFYKTGYTDACNKIGVLAVREIKPH